MLTYFVNCLQLMGCCNAGVFAIGPTCNLRGPFRRRASRSSHTFADVKFKHQICENSIQDIRDSASGTTLSGVFFTGDRPSWILATDKSGVQLYPSGHAVVHAFTPCSLWESKGDFLLYSDEVLHLP